MVKIQLKLTRRWSVVLLLLPLIVILLGGGFASTFMMQPTRPPNNRLVWETVGNPDSFDPAVDNTQFGHWMISNIYETLYTYPFNSSATEPLIPLLAAEQPSISADGKNYTIELRQGITFHDGTPFNASCVKWNIERAMKIFSNSGVILTIADFLKGGTHVKETALSNGTSSAAFKASFDDWIANSGAIETPDVHTIRFVLEKPFSPFITLLASGATFVMSPTFAITHSSALELETWEAYGVDYGDDENYMNTHTCGTGPYTLFEWIPDQYIRMDLYVDYWRDSVTDSEILPPAYAGSITTVFVRINEEAWGRELNLRAGVVDGIYWPLIDAFEILDPDEGLTIYEGIHVSSGGHQFATTFFGFNMNNLTVTINSSNVSTDSPFRNKNFRRAASFAFDYCSFIDAEVGGFGVQGKGPIPLGMPGYNDSSFKFDYNITSAVAEWNLAIQDPEFVLSLNSINSTLTFYYIEESTLRNVSVSLLQQGLEEIFWHSGANHTGLNHNMTIMIEGVSYSVYLEYLAEGRLLTQPFGWTPEYADPISYLYPICHSEGELAQQIGFNNTDIDQLYEQAIAEINTSQRQVYLNNIQDTVADEAPYLWAYQQLEFRTWRDWISGDGLTFNPMHEVYFYHINKVLPSESTSYFIPMLGLPEIIFLVLLSYVMANSFLAPTLRRKQIKFALLVSYTVTALFLTAWVALAFGLYPWVWSGPGGPWSSSVLSLSILSMLWVPWSFLYHDYKKELESMKPRSPTVDLE